MRLLLSLVLLTSIASAQQKPLKANALLTDWTALMESGCNLAAHRVRTPFEASVLRSTPYAVAGYIFRNTQLRALFVADGRWYSPRTSAPPVLGLKATRCVQELRALEATMTAQAGTTLALKAAALRDRRTYWDIREHSRSMAGGPSTLKRTSSGLEVRCAPCKDLRFYAFACPAPPASCEVTVPGPADFVPND